MNLLSTVMFDWSKFNPTWLMFTIAIATVGSAILVAIINNCHLSSQKTKERNYELDKIDKENKHKEKMLQDELNTKLEIKRLEQINSEKMSRINGFMAEYGRAISSANRNEAKDRLLIEYSRLAPYISSDTNLELLMAVKSITEKEDNEYFRISRIAEAIQKNEIYFHNIAEADIEDE